jgi:hypothetical protein
MKKINRLCFILGGILPIMILGGCVSQNDDSGASNSPSGTIITLDSLDHDWGDISIDGGLVEQGFHFKNESDETLNIFGANTSCMCTSVIIELPDGSLSPTFGMHSNFDWSYEVQPGEEFEVEVIFDPMAHGPDAVGLIKRDVNLTTSDKDIHMTVSANVLYDDEYQKLYADSDFLFEETEFDFGIVKQSADIVSHDFPFTYNGAETVTVIGVPTSCACVSAEISEDTFEKGDEGVITVSFDPNLHEEPEGRFFKTINLLTSPEMDKNPEVKIWAEMDLDLGPDAYKLKQHKD